MVTMYAGHSIKSIVSNKGVIVENPSLGQDIVVILTNLMTRRPVVGDKIVYFYEDSINKAFFAAYVDDDTKYLNELPVNNHEHQLLNDSIIANMALSYSQKNDIRDKSTGGIK